MGKKKKSREPEPLDMEDLKAMVIGVLTSAVMARDLDDDEERLERFTHDFQLVVGDITPRDLYRLTSVLADTGGALIRVVSEVTETDSEVMMGHFAKVLMETPTIE